MLFRYIFMDINFHGYCIYVCVFKIWKLCNFENSPMQPDPFLQDSYQLEIISAHSEWVLIINKCPAWKGSGCARLPVIRDHHMYREVWPHGQITMKVL